ncbi:MAG: hypothetical protein F6K40_24000 [Okeania sp. SIO3I5]|uniref:hypothetical protein n=1 Tax=Okeania sp. SIO3I5 TaxID=2607805 RepID=UPI0013BBC935|nr:hypothetical protein [Okeania sp. SIO3I5]NEQ39148.1 hypothetical protein [Okeania sp. SIO3I5]
MKDRISEPVSGYFVRKIQTTGYTEIVNFPDVTSKYQSAIVGTNYNFNYGINFMKCSYYLPALTPKPYQEYLLTDNTSVRTNKDIKYSSLYNETTKDKFGRYHAVKLTMFAKVGATRDYLGDVLLYNSLVRLNLPLMQYLSSPVMSSDCIIECRVNAFYQNNEIIVSGSYSGNMNYTFDTGASLHDFV